MEDNPNSPAAGSIMTNVPIKGIAGWIISILCVVSSFLFWQKSAADKALLEQAEKRADDYASEAKEEKVRADLWREKYFGCEGENGKIELLKQFGVVGGRKTLTITPNTESNEN